VPRAWQEALLLCDGRGLQPLLLQIFYSEKERSVFKANKHHGLKYYFCYNIRIRPIPYQCSSYSWRSDHTSIVQSRVSFLNGQRKLYRQRWLRAGSLLLVLSTFFSLLKVWISPFCEKIISNASSSKSASNHQNRAAILIANELLSVITLLQADIHCVRHWDRHRFRGAERLQTFDLQGTPRIAPSPQTRQTQHGLFVYKLQLLRLTFYWRIGARYLNSPYRYDWHWRPYQLELS